jgi:inosose dehydratase
VGIVPLVFRCDDLPELTPPIDPDLLMRELERLGYSGVALSSVLPPSSRLPESLRAHGLRLSEAYAALPCDANGPGQSAREMALARLDELHALGGEVFVFSYHLSPGRTERAGRATRPDTRRLTEAGWQAAITLIHEVARRATVLGHRFVYHPHIGTYVETGDEVDRLLHDTDPSLVGLCLDVGHFTVGGGDSVAGLRRYRDRVQHVHFKDVDPQVLNRLRADPSADFLWAVRNRLFTELGAGCLDAAGIAAELSAMDYRGWIMCEQDSTWRPAVESAAISRAVLGTLMRQVDPTLAGVAATC